MAKFAKTSLISAGVSALICSLASVNVAAQSEPLIAQILPPAKSGECYAKVSVPAKYKTELVDVQLKAPTERYQIVPAKFADKSKRVMTREASSTLTAIQPVLEVENDSFLVSPARTEWVRDSLKGTIPLSAGERSDIAASGGDIDAMPVGSCMYEHYVAPTVKEVPNRVLISEATEKLSTTPAAYRKATESVLVKAGFKRLIEVPAVFKKQQDRVLVEAAHSVWEIGTGPIQRIDNQTGAILCRVDIPAQYETVDIDVIATAPLVTSVTEDAVYRTIDIEKLTTDAIEKREPVAAEFKSMNKKQIETPGSLKWLAKRSSGVDGEPTGRVVCHKGVAAEQIAYERTIVKTPGSFTKASVPATFETVTSEDLVADATSVKVPVEGISGKVERRVKIADSRFEWQSVLCETNTTDDIIKRLQAALTDEGFNVGSIDGILGQSTLTALESYQEKNQLAEGGVTMESMEALGVEL